MLAMIVEKVSGKPFGEFLRERIFVPLGMKNTLGLREGEERSPASRVGIHEPRAAQWVEADQSSTSAVLGDGGIYSNVEDLAKWDRALREHTLLSTAEMQAALTPVKVPGGARNGRRHADRIRFRMVSRSLSRPPAYLAFGYDDGLPHIHRSLSSTKV